MGSTEISRKSICFSYRYEYSILCVGNVGKSIAHQFKKIGCYVVGCDKNIQENLIGIQDLKMLGSDSYLINISRGNIIVENDLIEALRLKIIKGAVIDVFSKEPLPRSSPLYKLDNVILTPHISGNINLFTDEIQRDFINKVLYVPHGHHQET